MIITMTVLLVLLTVAVSSAVAATGGPEEVIRALNKVHRPWEHKELNLSNRAVRSKYFSPELTKLFLKNAQVERGTAPRATSAELSSTQFSDLRTSTMISGLIFASRRERPRLVGSKHISNCLTNYGRN